jgi:hypothetical protein
MRIRVTIELDVESDGFDLEGKQSQVKQAVEEAMTNALWDAADGFVHVLDQDISIVPTAVHVLND